MYRSFRQYFVAGYAACFLLVSGHFLIGQTVTSYSPVMGGIQLDAAPLRETRLGLPLHRSPVAIAELGGQEAINNSSGNYLGTRLNFSDSIGNTVDFNPHADTGEIQYFVEFVTGAAAGQRMPILGSSNSSVIVGNPPQGELNGYFGPRTGEPRDVVYIRPSWTLESVLDTDVTLEAYGTGDPATVRNGDAAIIESSDAGTSGGTFQRFGDTVDFWGEVSQVGALRTMPGSATPLALDKAAVLPGTVLKIRRAYDSALSYFLAGDASSLQDWTLSVPQPGELLEIPFSLSQSESVTLGSSGLDTHFLSASSVGERQDELIVWDENAGFYARPIHRFYILNGAWREVGDAVTDQGNFLLEPGKGYLIRRRR